MTKEEEATLSFNDVHYLMAFIVQEDDDDEEAEKKKMENRPFSLPQRTGFEALMYIREPRRPLLNLKFGADLVILTTSPLEVTLIFVTKIGADLYTQASPPLAAAPLLSVETTTLPLKIHVAVPQPSLLPAEHHSPTEDRRDEPGQGPEAIRAVLRLCQGSQPTTLHTVEMSLPPHV